MIFWTNAYPLQLTLNSLEVNFVEFMSSPLLGCIIRWIWDDIEAVIKSINDTFTNSLIVQLYITHWYSFETIAQYGFKWLWEEWTQNISNVKVHVLLALIFNLSQDGSTYYLWWFNIQICNFWSLTWLWMINLLL